jgi:hypothetical protein
MFVCYDSAEMAVNKHIDVTGERDLKDIVGLVSIKVDQKLVTRQG